MRRKKTHLNISFTRKKKGQTVDQHVLQRQRQLRKWYVLRCTILALQSKTTNVLQATPRVEGTAVTRTEVVCLILGREQETD